VALFFQESQHLGLHGKPGMVRSDDDFHGLLAWLW
jgi:hypothetical protein